MPVRAQALVSAPARKFLRLMEDGVGVPLEAVNQCLLDILVSLCFDMQTESFMKVVVISLLVSSDPSCSTIHQYEMSLHVSL